MPKQSPNYPSLLLLASLWLVACQAPSDDQVFSSLFAREGIPKFQPGAESILFWVNGDTDHFVPVNNSAPGDLVRGDAYEVKRLDEASLQCKNCNIFVVHEQRGGARWYTTAEPWATYLRVYVNGKQVLERHVPSINGANPAFLTRFLQFAESLAPEAKIHLVYRGHSFQAAYDPATAAKEGIAPFIYSHPEEPYGLAQFKESLQAAALPQSLESITLAACSMAYMETAVELSPFSRSLIAPQVDFLENTDVGIDYSWLALLGQDATPTTDIIATHLMDRFDSVNDPMEAMMEYPVTKIDLEKIQALLPAWQSFVQALHAPDSQTWLALHQAEIISMDRATYFRSDRYVNLLKSEGEPADQIKFLLNMSFSSDQNALDVIEFLDSLTQNKNDALFPLQQEAEAIASLRTELLSALEVSRNPFAPQEFGLPRKSGLSFDFW